MLLFGWIAGILSNIYNIPQIYHTWKTKSSKDISIISILFRLTSYIFYIIHAYIIKDPPLFWNTLLSFVQVIIITIQYFIYKKKEGGDTDINNDI
jgi:MtN3 and saliva related transmembrane protein